MSPFSRLAFILVDQAVTQGLPLYEEPIDEGSNQFGRH